jgi:hypothetical protein
MPAYGNTQPPQQASLDPTITNKYSPHGFSAGSPWGTMLPSPYGKWRPDAPATPSYFNGYDPESMSTTNPLDMQLNGINLDKRGLDQFRNEALRTGPSQWASKAGEQQNLEEMQAREHAGRQAKSGSAGAMSDLAMRGGLTGGARERVAKSGARNYLDVTQDTARQGSQNRLQIGVNDEQNRIQQLGMLPGMETQALQPDFQKAQMLNQSKEFDVNAMMQEAQNRNIFTGNAYNQQMKGWAAEKTAKATADSGGSCWLISRLAREVKLPADEAGLLTRFKHYMLGIDPDGSKFYIRRCGKLIENMDAAGFDWPAFRWFNDGLMSLMRAGEQEAAYSFFRAALADLLMKFWPECPHKLYMREVAHRMETISRAETTPQPHLAPKDARLADPCLQNLRPEQFQPA